MRILKYIFLLLLLAFVALFVFVATQKGQFDITRSKVIQSPRSVVFNYINDYRNWENWGSWKKDDPDMQFTYPVNTVGKGGSYSWKGSDSEGSMQTVYVKDNDSISQKMEYNGAPSEVYWKFKDTVGGTKVTWRTKGKMNFMFKIFAAAKGGAEKVIGTMYERSLANLDKTLDYELKTFSIKANGVVQKPSVMYLHQTITSKISNLSKNLQIMLPKMIHFFKKNNMPITGKPFVIYHSYDTANGLTRFSVCMPVREEIFISEGSDIGFGKSEAFQGVKVTLNGDYSHMKAAWDKGNAYITEHKLEKMPGGKRVEVYTKGMEEIKSPSQWITEIYIPVKLQEIAPQRAAVQAVPVTPKPAAQEAATPAE